MHHYEYELFLITLIALQTTIQTFVAGICRPLKIAPRSRDWRSYCPRSFPVTVGILKVRLFVRFSSCFYPHSILLSQLKWMQMFRLQKLPGAYKYNDTITGGLCYSYTYCPRNITISGWTWSYVARSTVPFDRGKQHRLRFRSRPTF